MTAARFIPLKVEQGTHKQSTATAQLLREIGGVPALLRFTDRFYEFALRDPALEKFLASPNEPHGSRLATWVAEKMSAEAGDPWTAERATSRSKCPVARLLSNGRHHNVTDRSSAHYAAWFSPKRPKEEQGLHFQLHDCRVWMRLHFWAAREAGLFDLSPTFESWYVRFIGHFVSVYEQSAPPFARESARWSADPKNIEEYVKRGYSMGLEILRMNGSGIPVQQARLYLPRNEAQGRESLAVHNYRIIMSFDSAT